MTSEHVEANLATAAYLKAKGYHLRDLTPIGRSVFAFSFEDPNGDARQTAAEYYNGGTVEAEKLIKAFGDLKTLLYETKHRTEKKAQNATLKKTHRTATR